MGLNPHMALIIITLVYLKVQGKTMDTSFRFGEKINQESDTTKAFLKECSIKVTVIRKQKTQKVGNVY